MFHLDFLQIRISGFLQRSSAQVQWSEGEEFGAPDANGEGFQGPWRVEGCPAHGILRIECMVNPLVNPLLIYFATFFKFRLSRFLLHSTKKPLASSQEEYFQFEIERNNLIILSRKEVFKQTPAILKDSKTILLVSMLCQFHVHDFMVLA